MAERTRQIVVIGNGMVGHRFAEKIRELDQKKEFRLDVFGAEIHQPYNRMNLTQYFEKKCIDPLLLAEPGFYDQEGIALHVGEQITKIDREQKIIYSEKGLVLPYEIAVLATGSNPFVPPFKGKDRPGVFVYRTVEDTEAMIQKSKISKAALVCGGGLLGLEAAKAAYDLGLEVHLVELFDRLMVRQLDHIGAAILRKKVEELGVKINLATEVEEILGDGPNGEVTGVKFKGQENVLEVQMVIVSTGVIPNDALARSCGLEIQGRGGIVVDDHLRTNDPSIYAIGEVAQYKGFCYGLVAPGYDMAGVVANNLVGLSEKTFKGASLASKLKLMGVHVASFGEYSKKDVPAEGTDDVEVLMYRDGSSGVYKKLLLNKDCTELIGGLLVGDTSDFARLQSLSVSGKPLPMPAAELILGKQGGDSGGACGVDALPDDCQICSCNDVTKGDIIKSIVEGKNYTLGSLKTCTKAGTGCGGCVPQVSEILKSTLAKVGVVADNSLCEHFPYSRAELYTICKVKKIKTFEDLLKDSGKGIGCEICKPCAGSIFASLWNGLIRTGGRATLQDTNDRYLANIQRGGTYSVVPRVPGGEIEPEKLIALGETAKQYGLYSKITGGQRVDLFGAQKKDLPDIWEKLVNAGFESGHAYGKALRTVKSCVGSTWCRFGQQDSVGLAIRIEERYKGIRAPHKLKGGVSGCIRECAEARGKDFGLIATDKGYNLYVGGNGGVNPKHAVLFATDVDDETAILYLDRYLMFYIQTADRLTRTAKWQDELEGGLEYLKKVIIDDHLGICAELDAQMQYLVDSYECEWKAVVDDPERQKDFRQFVGTDETQSDIEFIDQRGQRRPADWVKGGSQREVAEAFADRQKTGWSSLSWKKVGKVGDFPADGGEAIKYGKSQLAVFRFPGDKWYCSQNMCPHQRAMVLARGITGDTAGGVHKVSCPNHKKNFNLQNGKCLNDSDQPDLFTFETKVEGDDVMVNLPPVEEIDAVLATEKWIGQGQSSCSSSGDSGCGSKKLEW